MDGDQCGSPAVMNTVLVKTYSGTNLVRALTNTRDRTLFELEQHSREIENCFKKEHGQKCQRWGTDLQEKGHEVAGPPWRN